MADSFTAIWRLVHTQHNLNYLRGKTEDMFNLPATLFSSASVQIRFEDSIININILHLTLIWTWLDIFFTSFVCINNSKPICETTLEIAQRHVNSTTNFITTKRTLDSTWHQTFFLLYRIRLKDRKSQMVSAAGLCMKSDMNIPIYVI